MSYTNFEVGQTFPLPIRAKGDGALFQLDANGAMFILQLSHTDIIAIEAFRTGEMEFALYEEEGLLFLLYQIDGIFKTGWGDAPLALCTLKEEQLPQPDAMTEPQLHLYLVDPRLHILLAMREITLADDFWQLLKRHVAAQLLKPTDAAAFQQKIGSIYQRLTSAAMREKAAVSQKIPLDIKARPLH